MGENFGELIIGRNWQIIFWRMHNITLPTQILLNLTALATKLYDVYTGRNASHSNQCALMHALAR